jgi:hypothetical protein
MHISDSVFTQNSLTDAGGMIVNSESALTEVTNCDFRGNTGLLFKQVDGRINIWNCFFDVATIPPANSISETDNHFNTMPDWPKFCYFNTKLCPGDCQTAHFTPSSDFGRTPAIGRTPELVPSRLAPSDPPPETSPPPNSAAFSSSAAFPAKSEELPLSRPIEPTLLPASNALEATAGLPGTAAFSPSVPVVSAALDLTRHFDASAAFPISPTIETLAPPTASPLAQTLVQATATKVTQTLSPPSPSSEPVTTGTPDSGSSVSAGIGTPMLAGLAVAAIVVIVVVALLLMRLLKRSEHSASETEAAQIDLLEPQNPGAFELDDACVTEASPLYTEATIESAFQLDE